MNETEDERRTKQKNQPCPVDATSLSFVSWWYMVLRYIMLLHFKKLCIYEDKRSKLADMKKMK